MNVSSERNDWISETEDLLARQHREVLRCGREHREHWFVTVRKANYSAFGGYRYTRSDYSDLQCRAPECGRRWRTNAKYVSRIPDGSFMSWSELRRLWDDAAALQAP